MYFLYDDRKCGGSRVAGTYSGVFVSVFMIPQVFLWIHSVTHSSLCTGIFFSYAQAKVLKYWKDSLTAAVSLLWSFYFPPFILSNSKSGQEGEGTTINQRILFQCSSSNSLTSRKKGRLTLRFKHVVLFGFQQQRAAFHRAAERVRLISLEDTSLSFIMSFSVE